MKHFYADINPMGFCNSGEVFAFNSKDCRDKVINKDPRNRPLTRDEAKKLAGKWPDFSAHGQTMRKGARVYGAVDLDIVYF